MNILISIIVPVYNVENFLHRCLQSIINQTHQHLEILLINDGSTDSSGSICDQYALKDSRIKVHHISNGGSSIARNFGLKHCSGQYIGFVDSDDWIKPNMYRELVEFSVKNNLRVVEINSTIAHLVDENSCEEGSIAGRIENRNTALKRIISETRFAVWRRLYHKSILKNRFFIEDILHQDVYYTIDILNEISYIGYIETPYYVYNVQNPTSVIRSDYSIKKLQSINAGAYVVENTSQYGDDIKNPAKQYLFNFLRYHYNSLFYNHELDEDYSIREEIRNTIKNYFSYKNFEFYSYVILTLPIPLYKVFLFTNERRMKIQSKSRQLFNNV